MKPSIIGLAIIGALDVAALGIDWLCSRVRPKVFLACSILLAAVSLSVLAVVLVTV